MKFEDFKALFEKALPIGVVLSNPGGGNTTIISYAANSVSYKRGNSIMRPSLRALFDAYDRHRGQVVSSSDLKRESPEVFDSSARPAGHSCNCTFLFLALKRMGLAGELSGKGVRGSPFAITVNVES